MEDNPKSSVDEQGMDKGKALVASDTDTEKMQKTDYVKVETIGIGIQWRPYAGRITGRFNEASKSSTATLDGIMEALTCSNYNAIGVLGAPESDEIPNVLEKVSRRAKRDRLFDVIVMANVSNKPNISKIQDEIGETLGLKFDDGEKKDVAVRAKKSNEEKDVAERAKRLHERMLLEQKILVMLCNLSKGLDLDKIGIPYGADHAGCKLLLTSATEDVLSKQMHAQKIFNV